MPRLQPRAGFMATRDGATVAGQPEVAAGWFPVNDHPMDKAPYTFHVTVPEGSSVVANGFLAGQRHQAAAGPPDDWDAREPMAQLPRHDRHRSLGRPQVAHRDRLPVYDAVDPDCHRRGAGPSITSSGPAG